MPTKRLRYNPLSGLSPRVRGNQISTEMSLVCPLDKVYPRVCGGTSDFWEQRAALEGLSPRVRGNRDAL